MRTRLALTLATAVASLATVVPAHATTPAPDGRFADPATYDVAIAHITDTQYLARCANGSGILPTIRNRCQAINDGISQWIVNQATARKIAYTVHTGDLIDSYWGAMPNLARGEMTHASQALDVLDRAGMPYGVVPGNHDTRYGKEPSIFNATFGPQRFARQTGYQGPWRTGDNSNHVDTFSAGGADFAVVSLGYGVDEADIAWANAEIAKRPRHNVIIATHAYLTPSMAPDGRGGGASADYQAVRRVVDAHRNVFLVLSGHEHGVATNVRTDAGTPGHRVVELMADYQSYSAGWDGPGHAGFLRLLQLDVKHGRLTVDTYSPSLDSHRSRDYDTMPGRRYDGREDEFTIEVSLLHS